MQQVSVAASSARQLTLQSQRTAASPSVCGSRDASPWIQTHGNSANAHGNSANAHGNSANAHGNSANAKIKGSLFDQDG
jgi:hypothetical protein